MGNSWAVDLANVGAVYPWQGLEVIMVLVAVAAWIIWHIIQISQENREFVDDIKAYGKPDQIRKALDEHPI
jgi:hypothetical protein